MLTVTIGLSGLSRPALGEEAAGKDTASALIPAAKESAPVYRFSEGKAETSMFGATAEGYKFVYVLDRSASMGGDAKIALNAVRSEFAKSLQPLDSIHQFQIVVYNERPKVFNPSGTDGRLPFASEQNKERAIRYLSTVTPDGGTRHDDALKTALRLQPDAIFFLTDGDKPELSDGAIEEISRRAAGITIHAIEFGIGPAKEGGFLAKLAKENRGRHVYVDLLQQAAKDRK